jgi:hypothetical protein
MDLQPSELRRTQPGRGFLFLRLLDDLHHLLVGARAEGQVELVPHDALQLYTVHEPERHIRVPVAEGQADGVGIR